MNRPYIIMACVLILCCSYQSKISDINIKTEIVSWWNSPDIDDVIITDIAREKTTAKVSAMVIVLDDTLREFIYKFEKFQKSWKITEGPDEKFRSMLSVYVDGLKADKLKTNMHTLQLAVEDFSTFTEGKYPVDFDATVRDICPQCKLGNSSATIQNILPTNIRNPFDREISAVYSSKRHPWDWSSDYIGKAVYFPMGIKNNYATAFIIKGSTDEGFLSWIIKSSNVKSLD